MCPFSDRHSRSKHLNRPNFFFLFQVDEHTLIILQEYFWLSLILLAENIVALTIEVSIS